MDQPIDFVITWVDGSDPAWRKQMLSHLTGADEGQGSSEDRFRDWDNLQYWFRGVERFAPWVRKIHFVTWGHVPEWLDTSNPKLNVVNHEDFIPAEYLPTFNVNPIELNLHRIPDLAEQFVYFNDDTFLCAPSASEDFFRNGVPRDVAALNVHCNARSKPIQEICFHDVGVINDHFDFKQSIAANRRKWLYPGYGKLLARTVVLLGCPRFPGFYNPHAPQPLLKSTYKEVWAAEPEVLAHTCRHKFRKPNEVNQYLIKDWQLAAGAFEPRPVHASARFFFVGDEARKEADRAAAAIRAGKTRMVCANDGPMTTADFTYCRGVVNSAFALALPRASSFERRVGK